MWKLLAIIELPAVDGFSSLAMGQWWHSAWPAVTCHPQSMRGKTFFLACLCPLHLAKYSLSFALFVHQILPHFGSFPLFLTIIFPNCLPVPFHQLSLFCLCLQWTVSSTEMKLLWLLTTAAHVPTMGCSQSTALLLRRWLFGLLLSMSW